MEDEWNTKERKKEIKKGKTTHENSPADMRKVE
jgi:hypothetical protein